MEVSGTTFLALLALIGVAVWLVSLRVHPWRHCRRCSSVPRTYGKFFPKSFRICSRCGGTGRQLRFGAALWGHNRRL